MFSLKHEFSNDWYRFLHPLDSADKQTLLLELTQERFPFQFRGRKIRIRQADVFLKLKNAYNPPTDTTPLKDYQAGPPLVLYVTAPNGDTKPGTFTSAASLLTGLPN